MIQQYWVASQPVEYKWLCRAVTKRPLENDCKILGHLSVIPFYLVSTEMCLRHSGRGSQNISCDGFLWRKLVIFFTFTYVVPMTPPSQDKKENTSAPAAAGPSRVQTQRRDAGVTAGGPARPRPHRAPPPRPGPETPDRPKDSAGLRGGPRRAQRHSRWPSGTAGPRLWPG